MKGKIARQFLLIYAAFFVVMGLIVRESVSGVVSPRGFAIALLAAIVPLSLAIFYVLKKARQAQADSAVQPGASTILKLRVAIVALLLCLVNGVWQYRHGPFLPVSVGVTINLFFTGMLIRLLIRIQRQTREGRQPRSSQ